MGLSNFERMLQLANQVFAVKDDPTQLDVNEQVLDRLHRIHPATVAEYKDENGPVAWVLLIPTTIDLMNRFLQCEISEKQLFELTPTDTTYESIYLCSAMVLEEYRRKGITRQLSLQAIEAIRKDHPLKAAFVWAFSPEGDKAAQTIAKVARLPLYKRLNDADREKGHGANG